MLNGIYHFLFEPEDEWNGEREISVDELESDINLVEDRRSPSPVIFSALKGCGSQNGAYARQGLNECGAIQRLKSTAWLNDFEIYDFLKHVASLNDSHKIFVMHSGYFPNGQLGKNILNESSQPYAIRPDIREKLLEAELILCPIQSNDHWYLMAISRNGNQVDIHCLDGYNRSSDHILLFNAGKRLIKLLYNTNTFEFFFKSSRIVEQANSYDCGPVICFYGALLCGYQDFHEIYRNLDSGKKNPYFEIRKLMIEALDNSVPQNIRLNEGLCKNIAYAENHLRSTPTRVCG